MRPGVGEVLHFSEDPTITRFVPHVAATAQQAEAYVWAVDHVRASCQGRLVEICRQRRYGGWRQSLLANDEIEFRAAGAGDVPQIVALLADDQLGAVRETPEDLDLYLAAFARVSADPNQLLTVAVRGEAVVGTMQLSFIPGLSRRGTVRCMIESVRIGDGERGAGLGTRLIEWAIDEARRRDCTLVQLTSDARRLDAHRFYQRLGFVPSHTGFKLAL